jgi:2'-5' RNA ligase
VRIFFAFEISDEIKSKISSELQLHSIDNIRFISEDNFHVTFAFLGEIKKKDLSAILNFVETDFCDISSFELSNPLIQFVPKKSPRILWVYFESKAREIINNKKMLLEKFIESLGYEINSRPYKFHLTLSRIKKDTVFEKIKKLKRIKFEFSSLKIERLTCFESILSSQGAKYRKIKSFQLK